MRLLVVEDDMHVAAALSAVLRRHGFEVLLARNAQEALDRLADRPDVILLDLGLPDRDGFDVCGRIRHLCDIPVIIVTARADVRARIHGLDLGADDYLVKPYDLGELLARIHAVSRRRVVAPAAEDDGGQAGAALIGGRVQIDPLRRAVTVDGLQVNLTRKEFDLLSMLAREPGVVFRREQIISEVWSTNWQGNQRTLEVHIGSLRAKLKVPDLIETVRGIGYRIAAGG